MLFAERNVDRLTLFGTIPAASLSIFNPLTILLMGPFLACLLRKLPWASSTKIALSFAFLASAFGILYVGCVAASDGGEVPLYYAIASIIMIALGEILIGPTVFAEASLAAPPHLQGMVMGMVTFGYSLANLLSGTLSQMMAVTEGMNSLVVYATGFQTIGLAALTLTVVLVVYNCYHYRFNAAISSEPS